MAINKRLHPGDGIGDRLVDAAVVAIEMAVGLTAAVDQAVATQRLGLLQTAEGTRHRLASMGQQLEQVPAQRSISHRTL